MTYCKPFNAGLNSETGAVCRRIGRLLTAIDVEVTGHVVEGSILKDLRSARERIVTGLEAEGWSMSYDGGNTMKVRQPGHKKPFRKIIAGE